MSLDLLNDSLLDIKVHSIQSVVPIGGGGSIADNSILNIKLVDKTVENTKIKDGTIISSLLDSSLSISNSFSAGGDITASNNIYATQTITGAIISGTTEISTPYLSTTQLHINSGTGGYHISGTSATSGGVITINTTAIGTDSFVLFMRTSDPQVDAGFYGVQNIVSGVSFDVFSSSGADSGSFKWIIINPLYQ